MNAKTVSAIYFSPTGTTERIVEKIADGIEGADVHMIDCTHRDDRTNEDAAISGDLVILAAPVYYGRIPEEIVPFFKSLKGENRPVVPVVVYGNREYEDALLELYDICVAQKFFPVAAAAFVAEHSYSTPERPIAPARPDADDAGKALKFGAAVKQKLGDMAADEVDEELNIPGSRPYIEPKNLNMIRQVRHMIPFTPETDADSCVQCGTCALKCPTAAIDPDNVQVTDRWNCMICFACVKNCPQGARQMTDVHFHQAIEQLQKNCQARKAPEIFI